MTDTPAVVSLTLGLVLKCFFIFPATDSWWSFSHTPLSCIRERKHHLSCSGGKIFQERISSKLNSISRSTYSDPRVLQDLQSRVPLIHLHLQHGSNQLLEQENTKLISLTRLAVKPVKRMRVFITLAVSDTLSQYGRGNSSCPIRIWSKSTSWSSLLLQAGDITYLTVVDG